MCPRPAARPPGRGSPERNGSQPVGCCRAESIAGSACVARRRAPTRGCVATVSRSVVHSQPLDHRLRVALDPANLAVRQGLRTAMNVDGLPSDSTYFTWTRSSAPVVNNEVVIRILAEGDRDRASPSTEVGSDDQFGKIALLLSRHLGGQVLARGRRYFASCYRTRLKCAETCAGPAPPNRRPADLIPARSGPCRG